MDLLEIMRRRRCVRTYTAEPVSEENLLKILQAGLLSPSGRARRPWEFIVVRNRETLDAMAGCRDGAASMLRGASCAIVVIADPEKTDVWVEDCSIVMANMQLMADSLGVGSCWIQGRLRTAGVTTSEDYLREILRFPDGYRLEAILSLGIPQNHPDAYELAQLPMEKIHRESY